MLVKETREIFEFFLIYRHLPQAIEDLNRKRNYFTVRRHKLNVKSGVPRVHGLMMTRMRAVPDYLTGQRGGSFPRDDFERSPFSPKNGRYVFTKFGKTTIAFPSDANHEF